jgi:serine/threonine-protein kinase
VCRIGEGGMGVVYQALDERLQRTVAIKTIRGGETAEVRERLWREARSLARVNHPNVCQLFDVGEDGGTLFLVLELLEGRSLADRLADGPLATSETLPIARQVLVALGALHGLGIVHRDLKPSNVFLTVSWDVWYRAAGSAPHCYKGCRASVGRSGNRRSE